MLNIDDLNSPERYLPIRKVINKKYALKQLYLEVYKKYQDCIKQVPPGGEILEIGSGAGFVREIIPNMITSDVVAYPHVDKVMNAMELEFLDESLSCICMFNVLHHIPNVRNFFNEALRTLKPNGRLFMVEPYPGWISTWVLQYLHHENFDKHVEDWKFESKGPVSDANNALPWIIFERDLKRFQNEFPQFRLSKFDKHTPLRYWLTGGLRNWSLLARRTYSFSAWIDNALIKLSPKFGSFVDIELIKTN